MNPAANDLQGFQALLEQVKEVFLQENNLLKSGRLQEYSQLMTRKRELVTKLEQALQGLSQMRENKTHTDKEQLRSLQDKLMQMLMIDRENEQLLLTKSMGNFQVSSSRVSSKGIETLYKKL